MRMPESLPRIVRVRIRIRIAMMKPVIGRPVEGGVLHGAGPKNEVEKPKQGVRFVADMREMAVISGRDAQTCGKKHPDEGGDFPWTHSKTGYVIKSSRDGRQRRERQKQRIGQVQWILRLKHWSLTSWTGVKFNLNT